MNWCGDVIKQGSTDIVSVKAIKVRLNEVMGTEFDVTNGSFGPATKEAVQAFQRKNQLIADGEIGELTWERLFTVILKEEPKSTILRVRALEIMNGQLFVREKTNHNDGAEVEAYLKLLGLPKGFPWCMALVYWSFNEAAKQLGVINPVPKTAGVLDCYSKAKEKYLVIGDPLPGDQFIMDFGEGKGHTGMVKENHKPKVYTVEGNTSADPTYAGEDRDGNGVFERNRNISGIKAFLRYD